MVESLTEQLPQIDLNKNLQDRKRKVERWLAITAGSAISILVVSVLWGIIYQIIIVKGAVLEGSIFLAFIVGLILFALLALYRDALLKASGNRLLSQQRISQAEETARLLPESNIESMPSVTEGTTERLIVEKEDSNQ